MRVDGRVAVVTGGTSGVGRATVRALARRGADVAVLARGADGLAGTRADVEALGRRALPVACDVADPEAVHAAARRVEEELGPIDVWVNNAMTTLLGEVRDTTPEEFRRITEVTYLGQVYGAMAALAAMQPRDSGVIVFVGSALAYRGIPLQAAYCGAKHGVQGFFDSLRSELLHQESGVRLSMVQLPGLNTPQFDQAPVRMPKKAMPVPPIFQPEVAAEAIIRAVENPRREWWVGLNTAIILAGNRVLPGLGDRYLAATGYAGQQDDAPEDPGRADYLWEPLPGDKGARGRFGEHAHESDPVNALAARVGRVTRPVADVLGEAAVAVLRRVGGS